MPAPAPTLPGDPALPRIAEMEAEVGRLKALLAERTGALLTLGRFQESDLPPASFTIAGLDERVLLVDEAGIIRYVNSGMAELLGAAVKRELLRAPLADWDGGGVLPRGYLRALVDATRESRHTLSSEHEVVETVRSPSAVLRFVSHSAESKVQIVVQDVTQLRWLERSFSRYVAPDIIAQMMGVPAADLLRVERRVVSVLFTDLRGFTLVCEQLAAPDVSTLLNSHFAEMIAAVHEYGGTVDKLMGDGMMAVFGAPLAQPDFALRALSAALAMQQRHARWTERQLGERLPTPGLGIGIATGEVVVGNIGSPERMDFTAIGMTVSLASRLCAAAESAQVLADAQTYRVAKDQTSAGPTFNVPRIVFSPAGMMQFKNISVPVEVVGVSAGKQVGG